MIGPFPNKDSEPLDAAQHPPESGVDLGASYQGLDAPIKWSLHHLEDNRLDLNAQVSSNKLTTAYAVACLVAEQDTDALLTLRSAEGLAVWCNGALLWKDPQIALNLEPGFGRPGGDPCHSGLTGGSSCGGAGAVHWR